MNNLCSVFYVMPFVLDLSTCPSCGSSCTCALCNASAHLHACLYTFGLLHDTFLSFLYIFVYILIDYICIIHVVEEKRHTEQDRHTVRDRERERKIKRERDPIGHVFDNVKDKKKRRKRKRQTELDRDRDREQGSINVVRSTCL